MHTLPLIHLPRASASNHGAVIWACALIQPRRQIQAHLLHWSFVNLLGKLGCCCACSVHQITLRLEHLRTVNGLCQICCLSSLSQPGTRFGSIPGNHYDPKAPASESNLTLSIHCIASAVEVCPSRLDSDSRMKHEIYFCHWAAL